MLDFRIESFLAVYELRSHTKAADQLCLTQPAVSQHIKHLEARFQTALFRLVGRQLVPTEAAELLYRYAAQARSDGRRVEALLAQPATPHLRIGATRTIGEYVLPSAVARYLAQKPETKLSLAVDNTEALLGQLWDGRIDVAFIEGVFPRQEYAYQVVMQDRFLPLCPPGDSWGRGTRDLVDLLGQRIIVREKGSGSRAVLENALEAKNVRLEDFHRVLEIGNVEAMKTLVIEGAGIAFLYAQSVQRELKAGSLIEIPLADFSVVHDYTFVHLKDGILNPAYFEFLDRVLSC